MTNTVQTEETPNPYNQKKDWHNEDNKNFVSANEGLYFEEPTERNKLFNSSDITEIEAEANADMRQTAQMGGVMDKNNPNALGVQGSILDNREDNYTNPMEQPPIRGAGYGR